MGKVCTGFGGQPSCQAYKQVHGYAVQRWYTRATLKYAIIIAEH